MRTRAILTILISLIIGFVLGFITEGQLVKSERNKWRRTSYSQIFENRILHILEPSESQKEQIVPIIKSYAQKMMELRRITGDKFEELRNQMNSELKQNLTEEQFQRLIKPRERRPDRQKSSRHPSSQEHKKVPDQPKNEQEKNTQEADSSVLQ